MAFFFAGMVVIVTLTITLAIGYANSMSDAPSSSGIPSKPVLVIGFGLAAVIVASHWVHFSW